MKILIIQKTKKEKILTKIIAQEYPDCNIYFASKIAEAKKDINEFDINLIIADLYFSDGNIFDVLDFNIPTIFFCEKNNNELILDILKKGAFDFIIKQKNYLEMLPVYIEKFLFQKNTQIIIEQNQIADMDEGNEKNNFFASVSHELRTPLNSILGFASLLLDEEDNNRKKENLTIIRDSSKYLLNIINDVLDLSKIEAKKLNIEKINFLLINTLTHIQNLFSLIAKDKKINFIVSISKNVPNLVCGDELRITQILINLISNAFKFTPEFGRIEFNCDYRKGFLEFFISDSGIGIPKNKLHSIFNPFEQGSSSTSRKYGGTGLGLTITKLLIKLMDGFIGVESEVNKGTKFSVKIPLPEVTPTDIEKGENMIRKWLSTMNGEKALEAVVLHGIKKLPDRIKNLEKILRSKNQVEIKNIVHQLKGFTGSYGMQDLYKIFIEMDAEITLSSYNLVKLNKDLKKIKKIIDIIPQKYFLEDETTEVTNLKIQKSKIKIIVAEDDEDNQKLIRAIFESMNLSCDIAVNGLEALNMILQKKYDILFLDMQMPVLDGISTIKKIRENEKIKDLYVIALTAEAMKGTRERMIGAGCNDFLTKPVDKELLKKKIFDMIG